MYELNYNFFFKINNGWFRYIPLFLIIFLFNSFSLLAQDTDDSQSRGLMQAATQDPADSNLDLDDNEAPESDITTKIYRSTDNLDKPFSSTKSELDPALYADVINKEDLINMHSHSKKKIVHRERAEKEFDVKKASGNIWLPWVLFTSILILLMGLIKIVKRGKI